VGERVAAVERGDEPVPKPKRPIRREGWARPKKTKVA
jgi:hypothetical protein